MDYYEEDENDYLKGGRDYENRGDGSGSGEGDGQGGYHGSEGSETIDIPAKKGGEEKRKVAFEELDYAEDDAYDTGEGGAIFRDRERVSKEGSSMMYTSQLYRVLNREGALREINQVLKSRDFNGTISDKIIEKANSTLNIFIYNPVLFCYSILYNTTYEHNSKNFDKFTKNFKFTEVGIKIDLLRYINRFK
jgi:hypothetical protein